MAQPERVLMKVMLTVIKANFRDFRFFVYNSKGSLSKNKTYHKDPLLELGVPDLVGYYKPTRRIVFIEVKYGKGTLNDNQKLMHSSLLKDGIYVDTCWSVEELRQFLQSIRVSEQTK